MLYRRFTIISLLILGTAFMGVIILNESYRSSHYKHSFVSATPANISFMGSSPSALKTTRAKQNAQDQSQTGQL